MVNSKVFKVLSLPESLELNSFYFVGDGSDDGYVEVYITGNAPGVVKRVIQKDDIEALIATHLKEYKAPLKDYEVYDKSPNIYNPDNRIMGQYLANTTGRIQKAANWSTTEFIPVTPGEWITFSSTARRAGISFFAEQADATEKNAILFTAATNNPYSVSVPAGAKWMIANIDSDSITAKNVQIERRYGSTPYRPFGGTYKVDGSFVITPPPPPPPPTGVLRMESDKTINITGKMDGRTIQIYMQRSNGTSNVLNFTGDKCNGLYFRTMSDDPAPVRMDNATIGANHGYDRYTVTCSANHGKVLEDVGSVYTIGGKEFVIIMIYTANKLILTHRTGKDKVPLGEFTHASGGVNQQPFTVTNSVAEQWYPAIRDYKLRAFVDDIEIDIDTTQAYDYADTVKLFESYSIMRKSDIVEYIISNPGKTYYQFDAVPALTVNTGYTFDVECGCTVYYNAIGRKETPLTDIMAVQASRFNVGYGPLLYYVPKTLDYVQGEKTFRLWAIEDLAANAPTSRILLEPHHCENPDSPPDRAIMMDDTIGFAIGYLPLYDAAPEIRKENAKRGYFDIRENSLKVYPHLVDSPDIVSFGEGDNFSAIAYRKPFARPKNRTANYVVRSNQGDYLYLDWHNTATTKVDEIYIASDLVGRNFKIVENSSNVTLLSTFAANSILVKVDNSKPYGYLVLVFEKD